MHSALRSSGHVSRMLVGRKETHGDDVRRVKRNRAWRALDRSTGALLDGLSLQYLFYPSSVAVAFDPWFRAADVVQLHNLHGSYFSFTALPILSGRRPVVWLLHDQWAMTGHVAYSFDCERWRTGCGSCPYLADYPRLGRDTTALLWRLKRFVYARSQLTLVAPSRWLFDLVQASPLLRRFPVRHIPNGIDTGQFAPGSRDAARRRLNLPRDRRIVFFAAADLEERRKGRTSGGGRASSPRRAAAVAARRRRSGARRRGDTLAWHGARRCRARGCVPGRERLRSDDSRRGCSAGPAQEASVERRASRSTAAA